MLDAIPVTHENMIPAPRRVYVHHCGTPQYPSCPVYTGMLCRFWLKLLRWCFSVEDPSPLLPHPYLAMFSVIGCTYYLDDYLVYMWEVLISVLLVDWSVIYCQGSGLGGYIQKRIARRASRFAIWTCSAWRTPWPYGALSRHHYEGTLHSCIVTETWFLGLVKTRMHASPQTL